MSALIFARRPAVLRRRKLELVKVRRERFMLKGVCREVRMSFDLYPVCDAALNLRRRRNRPRGFHPVAAAKSECFETKRWIPSPGFARMAEYESSLGGKILVKVRPVSGCSYLFDFFLPLRFLHFIRFLFIIRALLRRGFASSV